MAEQYWLPQAAPVCVYVLFADDPIATQGGTSNDRALYVRVALRDLGNFEFLIWEHIREAHFRAEERRSREAAPVKPVLLNPAVWFAGKLFNNT